MHYYHAAKHRGAELFSLLMLIKFAHQAGVDICLNLPGQSRCVLRWSRRAVCDLFLVPPLLFRTADWRWLPWHRVPTATAAVKSWAQNTRTNCAFGSLSGEDLARGGGTSTKDLVWAFRGAFFALVLGESLEEPWQMVSYLITIELFDFDIAP